MPRPQQMHLVPLSYVVNEAVEFIRANEPIEGYALGFSGGKDSICIYRLTEMAGVKFTAYYSVAMDAPEIKQFIRKHYPKVVWLTPKESFWEGIQRRDPPTRVQRWCCDVLKKAPTKSVPLKNWLLGIRAEESATRAKRGRIDTNPHTRHVNYKPIFNFKEFHVWDLIESEGLAYPELYEEFHRVGCIVCPFICSKNLKQVTRNKNRWPGVYRAFEHAVTRWFDAKRKGNDKDFDTAQEYLEAWFRGFE